LKAENRLRPLDLPADYAYFDMHHVTYEPRHVTAGQLLAANRAAVRRATSVAALLRGLWRTWRRTGSPLGALAAMQNSYWARLNGYQ
jgi:hypothetical protein